MSLPKLTIPVFMIAESSAQCSSVQCHHHHHPVLIKISVHGKVNMFMSTLLDFAPMDSVQGITSCGESSLI